MLIILLCSTDKEANGHGSDGRMCGRGIRRPRARLPVTSGRRRGDIPRLRQYWHDRIYPQLPVRQPRQREGNARAEGDILAGVH